MKATFAGCPAVKPRDGSWTAVLAQYRKPDTIRSTVEIAATAIPFVALWTLTAVAVANGYWLGLLLTVPAAGFLVRLFILQHDCGHGALFARRGINDWTGRVIGVFTLTPYDYWRRTHAVHHATAGNLDKRGIGDVSTLTVREYRALSRWGRIGYRLYRHPAVMFGIGPAWLFVCQYRLPLGLMRAGLQPWVSTIATNIGATVPVVGLVWLLGIGPFLMVQVPITLIAATAGVWLFFIQHQFEQTHWSDNKDWKFQDAALYGSSHYDLPFPLRWITGNIGIHHVHHMAAKVPFYRLPEVLRDYPDLRHIGRITLFQSFSCVKLVLWDEQAKRLVSFREALQN
ncbi:fatty acid desaturase [Nitratireductor aquimarinus]|uniref:Fatty acid desaturase n=1 Tax=Nitratireductor aquimarinus TaxID=889300 RepID=A0ABU4AG96_9HYPH|nr:fatty acid desaturase [Nitratireductor aquimarinus]MDV6225282.1 fatty acid desaturase [Nitratireductor aquimarinus]